MERDANILKSQHSTEIVDFDGTVHYQRKFVSFPGPFSKRFMFLRCFFVLLSHEQSALLVPKTMKVKER